MIGCLFRARIVIHLYFYQIFTQKTVDIVTVVVLKGVLTRTVSVTAKLIIGD